MRHISLNQGQNERQLKAPREDKTVHVFFRIISIFTLLFFFLTSSPLELNFFFSHSKPTEKKRERSLQLGMDGTYTVCILVNILLVPGKVCWAEDYSINKNSMCVLCRLMGFFTKVEQRAMMMCNMQ